MIGKWGNCMTKESVPGIDKVKKMENSGNFAVEKVVGFIDANKDIIRKVEAGDYSISVHMNLNVNKRRLVDGIVDMYSIFHARAVDLRCDVGVRIFKFWWNN